MTNKKKAKNNTVNVPVKLQAVPAGQGTSKSAKRRRKRRAASSQVISPAHKAALNRCPWFKVLMDPFSYRNAKIPDDQTAESGTIFSQMFLRLAASPIDGVANLAHCFGIIIPPHHNAGIFVLQTAVNGTGTLNSTSAASTYCNRLTWYNEGSMLPGQGKERLVAMGIRVIYEGTEMQRSGRYVAGTVPTGAAGFVTNALGDPLGTCYGQADVTVTDARNRLTNMVESRVSDGVFEAVWKPNGIPSYQMADTNWSTGNLLSNTSAGENVFFSAAKGEGGVEAGQNCLIWWVENDLTATANVTGNLYSIEIHSHWEVIPNDPESVVYDVTPSPFQPMELAACLNALPYARPGRVLSSANIDPPTRDNKAKTSSRGYSDALELLFEAGMNLASGDYAGAARKGIKMLTY